MIILDRVEILPLSPATTLSRERRQARIIHLPDLIFHNSHLLFPPRMPIHRAGTTRSLNHLRIALRTPPFSKPPWVLHKE